MEEFVQFSFVKKYSSMLPDPMVSLLHMSIRSLKQSVEFTIRFETIIVVHEMFDERGIESVGSSDMNSLAKRGERKAPNENVK